MGSCSHCPPTTALASSTVKGQLERRRRRMKEEDENKERSGLAEEEMPGVGNVGLAPLVVLSNIIAS